MRLLCLLIALLLSPGRNGVEQTFVPFDFKLDTPQTVLYAGFYPGVKIGEKTVRVLLTFDQFGACSVQVVLSLLQKRYSFLRRQKVEKCQCNVNVALFDGCGSAGFTQKMQKGSLALFGDAIEMTGTIVVRLLHTMP